MKMKLKSKQIIFIVLLIIFITLSIILLNKKNAVLFFPQHNLKIQIELAKNIYQQQKGLMFRDKLNDLSGMLFVFPDETKRSFWMKNTKIPLDLIFISKDKKIIEIKENFTPCKENNCPMYNSQLPAQYVLEVNAGFVLKNKIQINEKLNF